MSESRAFLSLTFHLAIYFDIFFEPMKLDVKQTVHPETNVTMYDLVSTQLYHDHPQVFDVLENIVIMAVIPIFTFVVVVVATTATVVQLKRVIDWRQRASANVDGTEVWGYLDLVVAVVVVVVVVVAVVVVVSNVVEVAVVVVVVAWW